jgi:hypothetical protein
MTAFGKTLVILNLFLSVLMMAWALALWTNRIDWSNRKGDDLRPPGELVEREAEARRYWSEIPGAFVSYRDSKLALSAVEDGRTPDHKDGRAADRAWYEAELEHLRTGATEANPARAVRLNQGLAVPDPKNYNRPTMDPARDKFNKNLLSMSAYNTQEAKVLKELNDAKEQHRAAIEEDTKLTERLIGPKGLQQRILDEKAKLAEVRKEIELIRPILINTAVESELILKRRGFLKARIEELKALDVAGTQQ